VAFPAHTHTIHPVPESNHAPWCINPGFDLHGNTFWEFKDAQHALRNRRIAKYHRSTHYGDVNVSPSWMQWLRHTRLDPPTIAEQQMDQERQERIKVLAARADARWAAKPSALDTPDRQQPVQMLQNRDPDRGVVQTDVSLRGREGTRAAGQQDSGRHKWAASESARTEGEVRKEDVKHSPWDTAHQSQEWQPTGWNPAPAKRSA